MQTAGVESNLVIRLVYLQARAVELVLEDGGAELGERALGGLRGLGQHRSERPEELELRGSDARLALLLDGDGNGRKLAAQHRGASDALGSNAERGSDRIEHDPLESALTQLAHDELLQERLLALGRAGEQG